MNDTYHPAATLAPSIPPIASKGRDWDFAAVRCDRSELPLLSEADAMHSTGWATAYPKVWPFADRQLVTADTGFAAIRACYAQV
jgi:hypothetical protein